MREIVNITAEIRLSAKKKFIFIRPVEACFFLLAGHALEPVLEIEDFIMKVTIHTCRRVSELLIGLLCFCFSPWHLDL